MKSAGSRYDLLGSDDTLNNGISHYSPIDHIDHSLYMNFVYGGLLDNYYVFLDGNFHCDIDHYIGLMNKLVDGIFTSDYVSSFDVLSFGGHYSPSLKGLFIDGKFCTHSQESLSFLLLEHFSMLFGFILLSGSNGELDWNEDEKLFMYRYFSFLGMTPVFSPNLIDEYRRDFSNKSLLDEKVSYRSSMVGLR